MELVPIGMAVMEQLHILKGKPKPPCTIHKAYSQLCSEQCPDCAYCTMLSMVEFERIWVQRAKEADK